MMNFINTVKSRMWPHISTSDPELSCGTILERKLTAEIAALSSLQRSTNISRHCLVCDYFESFDLVPNLLRVDKLWRWIAQAGNVPLLKMTTENNTDAMRNVCGIRLVRVVGVKELVINSFPRHLIWNRSCLRLKQHATVSSSASFVWRQKLRLPISNSLKGVFYVSFRVTNHSCWPWRPDWLIQPEWRVLPGNNYFPVLFLTYRWRLQFVCGKMCKVFPLPFRWLISSNFSSHSRSYVTSEALLMKPTSVKTKAVEPSNSPNLLESSNQQRGLTAVPPT